MANFSTVFLQWWCYEQANQLWASLSCIISFLRIRHQGRKRSCQNEKISLLSADLRNNCCIWSAFRWGNAASNQAPTKEFLTDRRSKNEFCHVGSLPSQIFQEGDNAFYSTYLDLQEQNASDASLFLCSQNSLPRPQL